jgi:uncharacterized short protein YbdD (DUF466 family)
MGDNHYQRYATHRRRDHPGEPVLSEAQYWRMRHRLYWSRRMCQLALKVAVQTPRR